MRVRSAGCTACGDGVIEGAEACEGADLGCAACWTLGLGFAGGALACAGCTLDDSDCFEPVPVYGGARDLNGDGWADLVIGADGNDSFGDRSGAAYVFFGGPGGPDSSVEGTLLGQVAGGYFGWFTALPGDLDGDGYAEVLVGAPDVGPTVPEGPGRAYLYRGGPGGAFDAAPEVTFLGVDAGDRLGASVAGAGDVNGDGALDVLIATYPNNVFDAGYAHVYLGTPGGMPDAVPDGVLTGEAASDGFGFRSAGAGDLDGDGYSDVVVGATGNDAGGPDAGRAYVYFGAPGATFDETADLIITGAGPGGLGRLTRGVGDTDGDGFDDLAVVAGSAVQIFLGGPALDDVADVVFANPSVDPGGQFGFALDAGDFNGDGLNDVVVGAPWSTVGGFDAGEAFVYLAEAGAGIPSLPTVVLSGAAWEVFGYSLAAAGDLDGDSYGDVAIGGPGLERVLVFRGGPGDAFDAMPDLVLLGSPPPDFFGDSVAPAPAF